MRLESDFHFQVRRQTPRGLPKPLLSRYGKINIGDIAQLVIKKLDEVVIFPSNRVNFSLFNIECMNGNSYGFRDISIDIPAAYLRFHFITNKNLDKLGTPTEINSRLVRYKTLKSDLYLPDEKPARVYSIGLTMKDLGTNYKFFKNRLGELEVLYNVLGPATKAHVTVNHTLADNITSMQTLAYLSPRYMIASYDPYYWTFNRYMWLDYPNLISDLSDYQIFFYLMFIHPMIKRRESIDIQRCSVEQRTKLGVILRPGNDDGSITDAIFRSLLRFIGTFSAEEYLDINKDNIERVNPCFLACFGNFYENIANYEQTKQFAMSLMQGGEYEIKSRIHQLLWN